MRSATSERILVPIDINHCPLEVFEVLNSRAQRPGITAILLHVINLNIVSPENRIYDELAREAQWHLAQLSRRYLHRVISCLSRVRFGKPATQILEEARAENIDLIILPNRGPSFRDRLRALWKPAVGSSVSGLTQKVMREANCGVMAVMTRTSLNCEQAWGRPETEPDHLTEVASFGGAFPSPATEKSW